MANIPDKPTLDGIENRWADQWDTDGTYSFDMSAVRDDVFSIDTPPPPSAVRCTWVTSSATPTPTSSPATNG